MLYSFVEKVNTGSSIATHVLLAIHMIFMNILLVNLLIAMFKYVQCEYARLAAC